MKAPRDPVLANLVADALDLEDAAMVRAITRQYRIDRDAEKITAEAKAVSR